MFPTSAYVSTTPKPGSVAVQPGTAQFSQIFDTLLKGATPIVQAELAVAMAKAQRTKKPVYVSQNVVEHANFPWGWLVGGVVALGALAFFMKKRK
jgi:hypothetical protein